MPQMSPMWWELLFMMFLTIMMIMMTMIYHNKDANISNMWTTNKTNQMTWKW